MFGKIIPTFFVCVDRRLRLSRQTSSIKVTTPPPGKLLRGYSFCPFGDVEIFQTVLLTETHKTDSVLVTFGEDALGTQTRELY